MPDATEYAKKRDAHREYMRRWTKANPEKMAAIRYKYRVGNREELARKQREYNRKHPDKAALRAKRYYGANRKRVREYKKEWAAKQRATDPIYRLKRALRKRVWEAVKNHRKSAKTMELTGCSMQFLRGWLESRFQPGMTWENYGRSGWHVDHVIPCDAFDFSDPEQQRQCFHYSNLQPLWEKDNLRKYNWR